MSEHDVQSVPLHEMKALRLRVAALEAALRKLDALLVEADYGHEIVRAALSGDTSALREMMLQTGGLVWAIAAPDREVDAAAIGEGVDRILGIKGGGE